MIGNLLLSSDRAVCTSTYPEYDYANITISVPPEMSGATFESAAFTYSQSQTSGTATIKFYDTRQDVSNARILERLNSGAATIELLFSFKASSGTKTKTWSGLNVAVEYKPAARLSGTATTDDGSRVFWAIDAASLARGESVPVMLTVTPATDCDMLSVQMRAGSQSAAFDAGTVLTLTAGRSVNTTLTLALPADYSMASRVMAAQLKIALRIASGGNTESGWESIGLNIVSVRNAPSVAVSVSDLSSAYSTVSAFVQGKSRLSLSATVSIDTADPVNAIKTRVLTFGGRNFEMAGNTVEISTDDLTGIVAYALAVTDGFGLTGTVVGNISVLPYLEPSISALQLERYTTVYPSTGGTEYPPDDGSPTVSIKNLAFYVEGVNGRNAYTLTASWDGGSRLIDGDTDGGWSHTVLNDRGAFNGVNFSPEREYIVTFTLSDALGGNASAAFKLPKAGGIFSIERGGVAVGKRSTGTEDAPRFECAYPATFEAGVFDEHGNRIGSVDYVLPETRIGTYLGKPLYRKGMVLTSYSTSSSSYTQVDMQIAPARVVKIEGFIKTNNYGDLPLNCYHSSSIRSFIRPDGNTGKLIGYCTNENTGAVIFVEYTKEQL